MPRATFAASGPEMRIIPIAPLPGAVAIAAMVALFITENEIAVNAVALGACGTDFDT